MEGKNWKNKLIQGTMLIALMGVTFYMLFREQDLSKIWEVVSKANPFWIWMAILAMVSYIFSGGFSIRVIMHGRGNPVTIPQCFEYSLIEIFFSSITPSSTGGQPMQLRAMSKDGHVGSDSSSALVAITLLYKCSFLVLTGLFFVFQFSYVSRAVSSVRVIAVLGLMLNIMLMSLLLIALFSKRLTNWMIRVAVKILGKIHFVKNVPEMMDKMQDMVEEYHECATFFKENPKQVLRTFGVLTLQRLSILIVPFFIYKSFGLSGQSLIHIIATQLIINLCCDMLPLPGAVGISEAMFLSLFGHIFTERNLYAAVLLSRGLTYYLLLMVSGLSVVIFNLIRSVKKKKMFYG